MDKRSQELLFLRNVLGTAVSNLVPDGGNAFSDALFSTAGDDLESGIQPTDGTKKLRIIGKTPKLYLQLTDEGLVVYVNRPDKDKNDHWIMASQSEQGEITLQLTSPKAIVGDRHADRIKKNGLNGTITLRFAYQRAGLKSMFNTQTARYGEGLACAFLPKEESQDTQRKPGHP